MTHSVSDVSRASDYCSKASLPQLLLLLLRVDAFAPRLLCALAGLERVCELITELGELLKHRLGELVLVLLDALQHIIPVCSPDVLQPGLLECLYLVDSDAVNVALCCSVSVECDMREGESLLYGMAL